MHRLHWMKLFLLAGLLFWVGGLSARAADLQVSYQTACALNDSGKVYCWHIRLPMSKTNDYKDPADGLAPEMISNPVPNVRFLQLDDARMALSQDGVLWQFDASQPTQPSTPYTRNYQPGEVRWKRKVKDNNTTHCGINQDDEILCFGWNIPETKQSSEEPVPMGLTGEYQDLAMAGFNKYSMGTICGIKKKDGSIWCAGKNGRDDNAPKLRGTDDFYEIFGTKVPTRVKAEGRFKRVFGGNTFCAQREDDTVWCWGTPDTVLPVQLRPGKFKFVAKDHNNLALVDEKGSIWVKGSALN